MDSLKARCKKFGIITDVNYRWEKGISHHPKSETMMKLIMEADMEFADDYFCWKVGGDGDNGESMMYLLDIIYELEDKENG